MLYKNTNHHDLLISDKPIEAECIRVRVQTFIGSDNGLSLGWRQAIIWTNAGILLIGSLEQTFVKFEFKFKCFHSRKCIWKCRLENGRHFVSICLIFASICHDDAIKWKHFPIYCRPFVWGLHRSPVNSPHKTSDRELWCLLLICALINGCGEAGDLRRHHANYDVTVMLRFSWSGRNQLAWYWVFAIKGNARRSLQPFPSSHHDDYRKISNIRRTKSHNSNDSRLVLRLSSPNTLKPGEWRCSWSSADRRCSDYIWVINNCIDNKGATYIRCLTVSCFITNQDDLLPDYVLLPAIWSCMWKTFPAFLCEISNTLVKIALRFKVLIKMTGILQVTS